MSPAAALAGGALGIASGVVAAIGTCCYVRGWLCGATPNRISWTWWTLVSAAVTGALALHHAAWPLLVMPAESTVGCGLILALSLIRGSGQWDATARALTAGVVAAVPAWLAFPRAAAAIALSVAVELAGDVPTIGGAWRNPKGEPASSWACVAVSGGLGLAAAAATGSQATGYLLPAAWVLGGTSIPAVAMLGTWARRVPGRREAVTAACFLLVAPAAVAVIALAGFEIVTGIHLPGIPVFTSAHVTTPAGRPVAALLPSSGSGPRHGHGRTRRPLLSALSLSAPPQAASPSPSRTRKPSPSPSQRRPSPTRTPRPTPSRTSPYPSPTTPATVTPSPTPTGTPPASPYPTGTPSPTPSPTETETYPTPSATPTPSPTYSPDQ